MTHTILVIDSDPVQLNQICGVLKEKLAYQAVGISGSRDATHHAVSPEALKPDLILFDISMVADNCSAITSLRALMANIPIVVLVKYGDYAAAMVALASGAQDFLTKPAATERLATTLHNALRLRDAQRESSLPRREQLPGLPANHSHAINALNASPPFSLINEDGNVRRMAQIEAEAIRFAMQYYNGRMTELARRLGIGRSTLYRKLSEFSIRQQAAA